MALDQATLDSIDQQTQDQVEAPEVQARIQPAAMAMLDEAVPIYGGAPNPPARASMSLAVSANADQYARAAALGKQYNVPADIAERNLDWLETKAKLDGFDAAAPGVQLSMEDPHIAKLSHDDIEKLSELESRLGTFGVAEPIQGPKPTIGSYLSGLGESVVSGAEITRQSLRYQMGDLFGFNTVTEDAARKTEGARTDLAIANPQFESDLASGAYSGLSSLLQQAPAMVAGITTGNVALPLAVAGVTTEAEAYTRYRERGASPLTALGGGVAEGAIEVATESIPMGFLVSKFGKAGMAQFLAKFVAQDFVGEQAATLLQDAVDTAVANPDKTWGEYMAERPSAFVQTTGAVAAMGGAVSPLHLAAKRQEDKAQKAQVAIKHAKAIEQMNSIAANDLLRQRSPEDFAKVLGNMAGAERDFYVDGGVFLQALESGGESATQALANAPTVLEQLDDALPTNGLIRIPAKEFMQSISGSGLDEALIPHLRVDPEAPSQMEAEQFLQVQAEETKAAVEQAMEKMVVDQAFTDSAHAVEANIAEQLNTAARYTPDENKVYAQLARDFIVTQAAREGITPEAWYAQHPLSILDHVPKSNDATLGQYGGAQAVQVDIAKNKDVADTMLAAGADPEQVRVATGWFNGQYDSKPRFEFSDQEAAFTEAFTNLPESQLFGDKQTMKLGDVLQHDELFKYYPEARDIDIVKRKGFIDLCGLQGWFDSKNEIGVTPYAQDPLSTVLHEVQHWIQVKEGFATGGNENAVFEALTSEQKARIAEKAMAAAQEALTEAADKIAAVAAVAESPMLRPVIEANTLFHALAKTLPPDDPARMDAYAAIHPLEIALREDAFGNGDYFGISQAQQRAMASVAGALRDGEVLYDKLERVKQNAEDAFIKAQQEAAAIKSGDAEAVKSALKKSGDMFKLYKAIAGEIEARDVQARQQMTAAERAATPPLSSETFDPKDVIVAFDKVEQASILAQDTTPPGWDTADTATPGGKRGPRGAFNPKTLTLSLLETANYSTFVHELGHYQLTVLADIASRPNAPAQVVEDMNKLLEWFKVPDLATWNAMTLEQQRPHHEQMAEGMETYMFEGRAPSIDLEPVFARIKQWMMRVYKSLVEMRVPLTDEVRAVFDRLYAVDQDIKAAEEARSMLPLFETREDFPGTDEEWQDYRDTSIGAHEAGAAQLQARSLRDMQFTARFRLREIKKLQKDAAEKRKAMMVEAEKIVDADPVYAVQAFLRSDESLYSPTAPDVYQGVLEGLKRRLPKNQYNALTRGGFAKHKLDLEVIKAAYGEDPAAPWRYLPTGKNGLVAKDGIDPDLIAPIFGYNSGDEMIRDIVAAEPRDVQVDGMTDQMMFHRYGDLTDARAIEQAVDEAIHNKVRTRMVATELSALETAVLGEKGKGRRPQMLKALRNLVKATMGGKRIGDIKVGQHVASETRAAKESSAALKKGDQKAAVNFKRQQMWHNLSAIEARNVEKEIDRALKNFHRLEKRPDSVAPEYLNQILNLLAGYDLARRSDADISELEDLKLWLDKVEEVRGVRPVVSAKLENKANRKNFRRVTLNDFRELVDAVKSIEHIGKAKQKLMTAAKEREVNNAAAAFAASATAHAPRVVPDRVESVGPVALARHAGAVVVAGHEKLSSWTRELDGYLDNGEATRLFTNTATAAGANEAVRTMRSTDAINKFFGPLIKRIGFMPFNTAKVVDGAVGRDGGPLSLSYQGRLMVVANMGNEVNYQRMRDGEGWTDATMAAVLNSLTKEDMQFVQAMWDHLDGYKTEIGALEKELTGVEPEWVEAKPLQTQHGTFAGGYFPIMYDSRRDTRAKTFETLIDASAMLRGARGQQTTPHGYTKGRVEVDVAIPVRKDFGVFFNHIAAVNHRLAWEPWVVDSKRLLKHSQVKSAFIKHLGNERYASMQNLVTEAALGHPPGNHPMDGVFGVLNNNATVAALAYGVMTSATQLVGINQSINRLGGIKDGGYKWFARGLQASMAGEGWRKNLEFVRANSEFMRSRAITQTENLRILKQKISAPNAVVKLRDTFFMPITMMQTAVDLPTWLGAYRKAVAIKADGGLELSDNEAFAFADRVVSDAQGSGIVTDMAGVQRGANVYGLFTRFYSYANTTLQHNLEIVRREKHGAKDYAYATHDMIMTNIVPAIMLAAMKAAFTGGDGDDDDFLKAVGKELGSSLLGMVVGLREFSSAVQGYDYQGPSGLRFFASAYRLGEQTFKGEFGLKFWNAAIDTLGYGTGLIPSGQINRTLKGIDALTSGDTDRPTAVLFGPPK